MLLDTKKDLSTNKIFDLSQNIDDRLIEPEEETMTIYLPPVSTYEHAVTDEDVGYMLGAQIATTDLSADRDGGADFVRRFQERLQGISGASNELERQPVRFGLQEHDEDLNRDSLSNSLTGGAQMEVRIEYGDRQDKSKKQTQ